MLGVSLGTHLINLICFYTLFVAFQQPISYGTLIAGYAMGILFAIVSPTPQGIGIAEGIVPLVLAPLGIPFDKAVVTVLAFRSLSLWLPLLIGFLVLGFRKIKAIL
jgi:glycosyltransferase 2 family protein